MDKSTAMKVIEKFIELHGKIEARDVKYLDLILASYLGEEGKIRRGVFTQTIGNQNMDEYVEAWREVLGLWKKENIHPEWWAEHKESDNLNPVCPFCGQDTITPYLVRISGDCEDVTQDGFSLTASTEDEVFFCRSCFSEVPGELVMNCAPE